MNTVERLRDDVVGAGLRRHGVRHGRADHPGAAVAARDGHGPVRPRVDRPPPGPREPPRAILKAQLARLAERGYVALAGTELELVIYDDSYEEAHRKRYRDLTPANQYNVDYSILGTTRVEPLLRDIRNHMYAAGLDVEGAKGECNFGQHEVGFLYADALTTADNHAVYKNAAKEIAAQHGQVRHVHGQAQRARGQLLPHPPVPARRGRRAGVLGRRERRAYAALRQLHRRRAGHDRRLHAAVRAEHQLLQAVRRRLVRADHDRLGPGQPHVRRPPGRVRSRRADGEPHPRRATPTPTSRWPR